jgi:predicted ATPase
LQVKGFKSLKDVTWEPGRLNVIIGPNGSGKSNLLGALSLLQQGAQGGMPQEILRQGGIGPLLWDGEAPGISWFLRTDPLAMEGLPRQDWMAYELRLSRLGATSAYRIEHESLESGAAGQPTFPRFLERSPGSAVTLAHPLSAGRVTDDQTLLSLFTAPWESSQIVAFRESLAGWTLYHDLRVDQQAPLRQASVARVEERISPDGQNVVPVLHTLYTGDREFQQAADAAMRAAFGRDYEGLIFPPAAEQRVQLRLRWRSLRTEQSAASLSDGTLRFLLLIAIFSAPRPGALIALDEPETGLHPSMLPIVAELAAEASQRTQVILSTHSADLLDAFSEVEQPTTTVSSIIDGQTRLSVLGEDELHRWLKHYRLGALMRSGELEDLA